jgi:hypothetical protein
MGDVHATAPNPFMQNAAQLKTQAATVYTGRAGGDDRWY